MFWLGSTINNHLTWWFLDRYGNPLELVLFGKGGDNTTGFIRAVPNPQPVLHAVLMAPTLDLPLAI